MEFPDYRFEYGTLALLLQTIRDEGKAVDASLPVRMECTLKEYYLGSVM